jgi:uncharacterized GH25 family protein
MGWIGRDQEYQRRMRNRAATISGVKRTLMIFGAAVLSTAAIEAHDFWIEPSTFRPSPGETVAIGLRVGEQFAGDPVPRSSLIERFVVMQDGREEEITGIEGRDPAGWIQARGGPAIIAYRSKPSFVELPAAQFEAYLRENGLERIIAARKRRGEQATPGREIFSRCAKAILNGTSAAPAKLRYEIIPESVVPFRGRLLFDGKPLAGALVVATYRDDPRVRLLMRSNPQGRFAFTSPRRGVWLITSVHMIEAPALSKADWESVWASLTLDLQSPRILPPPKKRTDL